MIVDTLDNLEKYVALNPLFADVVAFMKEHHFADLEDGKHLIQGNDLFLNLTTITPKTREAANLEWHRRMIDIQIPLDGEEIYGYTPVSDLPDTAFNEEKDVAKANQEAQTYVRVEPGQMAIFFPQDGHAPCISPKDSLRKAIFKVKMA